MLSARIIWNIYIIYIFKRSKKFWTLVLRSVALNCRFLYSVKTILNLLGKNKFETTVFLLTLQVLEKIVTERSLL